MIHWKRALILVAVCLFLYFMPYHLITSMFQGGTTVTCNPNLPSGQECGIGSDSLSGTFSRWIFVGTVSVDSPIALRYAFLPYLILSFVISIPVLLLPRNKAKPPRGWTYPVA